MASPVELQVRLIEQRAQLPLSSQQWNLLVARSETNTVFQTFEWFDAWWRTFGDAHRLFFLAVYRGDVIAGFAAFMLVQVAPAMQRLEFVGTGNADYQDIIAAPQDKAEVIAAICGFLRKEAGRWHRAWLCNIPSHSSTRRLLSEATRNAGLFVIDETQMPCAAMQIAGCETAVSQLLGKYSLRRPLNWFSKRGTVRFRHVAALDEIEALLSTFFEQHVHRWQAVGNESLFTDVRQRSFYTALVRSMHSPGWLQFSVLELDGQPIAFHLGFDYAQRITWYKPTFGTEYAEHSPGLLLIRHLIEDALLRGRAEIDFTVGDEAFKERFANVHRSNLYLGMYHSRVSWFAAETLRRMRRLLRRLHPRTRR